MKMKTLIWRFCCEPLRRRLIKTKIVRRRSEEKKRGDVTLENNTSYRYKILVVNIWPDPKMMNNWYLFFINRIFTNKKMFCPFHFFVRKIFSKTHYTLNIIYVYISQMSRLLIYKRKRKRWHKEIILPKSLSSVNYYLILLQKTIWIWSN